MDVAHKPQIYKFAIELSDLERQYYDSLALTVARHPSETAERMMVRVLAYCLNARPRLVFGKGLSTAEEPDLWAHALNGEIEIWIDVGEPAPERVKKASHLARQVRIYSFNTRAPQWWQQGADKLAGLRAEYFRFRWEEIQTLAAGLQRGMDLSVTISGDSAFVAWQDGECEIHWFPLRPA